MQTPHSRSFSRLRSLGPDPRVLAIQEAVRACDAAGRARGHVMRGEARWPEHYVALLNEFDLHGVPAEQIVAVGEAMREAALSTVYVGNAAPSESLGEVLALEAVAEGEANRDTAKLIDAPMCPSRKQALVRSFRFQMARIDRAVRVLLRDLHRPAVSR